MNVKTEAEKKEIDQRIIELKNRKALYQTQLFKCIAHGTKLDEGVTEDSLFNQIKTLDAEIRDLKELQNPKRGDKPFSEISINELTEILIKILGDSNTLGKIIFHPSSDKTFVASITWLTKQTGENIIRDETLIMTATNIAFERESIDKKYVRKYQTLLNENGYFADDLFDDDTCDKQKETDKMVEQTKIDFLNHIWNMIEYWNDNDKVDNTLAKLEGLSHSILVALDGNSCALPGFAVMPIFDENLDPIKHTVRYDTLLDQDISGDLHELFYPIGKERDEKHD